jgi:IS30 family transposase
LQNQIEHRSDPVSENRFYWIRAQKIHFNLLVEYELPQNNSREVKMDHSSSPHQKGKRLSKDDRITIQVMHSMGCSNRAIARELICSPSTIVYDQKRHRIPLYWQCETIKSYQGTNEVKRNTKARRARANKRILGRSIDERSLRIDTHKDFEHWECDLVLGYKSKDDDVLLTLCEQKTRRFFMIKIEDKTSASIMKAFYKLREFDGSKWNRIFKSITTDNGFEFADLSNLEQVSKTLVYYAHPYTSCNKGSVERHNGLIRRYIPKGDLMDKYSVEDIAKIEVWCNSLPRKILNYKTPEECFDVELDHIYRRR